MEVCGGGSASEMLSGTYAHAFAVQAIMPCAEVGSEVEQVLGNLTLSACA